MRAIQLASVVWMIGCACQAREPASGLHCHYSPTPVAADPYRTAAGGFPCAGVEGMGNMDPDLGGDPHNPAGEVEVIEVSAPPYIKPGCEAGREMRALIRLPHSPGSSAGFEIDPWCVWVFPRYLSCR